MVASVFLAVVAAVSSPAPSPAASSLPVIVHTVTSLSCTTLHDTIMPIGFVLKKDDEAFGGMSDRLGQIFTDFANQGGAPTREQLMQLGDSKAPAVSNGPADASGPAVAVNAAEQEIDQFYSPSQVVKASQIDAIANAVYGNLSLASQVMAKSVSALPEGSDAKADEMRARAQNLMELQHTFADNYENFVKTYVNNQNVSWAVNPDQRGFVNAYLMALLTGKVGDHGLTDSERAHVTSIAGVVQNLRQGEQAFGSELISTYNQCNSTHITVEAPSPKP